MNLQEEKVCPGEDKTEVERNGEVGIEGEREGGRKGVREKEKENNSGTEQAKTKCSHQF